MTFYKQIKAQRVAEWMEAYLEYGKLKKLLIPAKLVQKKLVSASYREGNLIYRITNRDNLRMEQVVICIRTFESLVKSENVKIDLFFQFKLLDLIQQFELLMLNVSFLARKPSKQTELSIVKQAFKILYKEASMVKDFVTLNQKGLSKILDKYSHVTDWLTHHYSEYNINLQSKPIEFWKEKEKQYFTQDCYQKNDELEEIHEEQQESYRQPNEDKYKNLTQLQIISERNIEFEAQRKYNNIIECEEIQEDKIIFKENKSAIEQEMFEKSGTNQQKQGVKLSPKLQPVLSNTGLFQSSFPKGKSKYSEIELQKIHSLPPKQQDQFKQNQSFEEIKFELVKRIQLSGESSYLGRNLKQLDRFMKRLEEEYLQQFYGDGTEEQRIGKMEFRQWTLPRGLSPNEVLAYGVFCGFSGLLLLFVVIKFVEVYSYDQSNLQRQQLSLMFPLFRGNGLMITYIWLLAWNVSGWQKSHVNYKLIFKFGHHFSQMYEILHRAAFFTLIYFVCFVWYILIISSNQQESRGINLFILIDWIDADLLPLIGWLILLIYIFFPLTTINFFNPQGRRYFFKLLMDCLKSPFVSMEFRIGWMTDMIVSFAGPLKDFETTVCFYAYKVQGLNPQICKHYYIKIF